MLLINCKVYFELNWIEDCILSSTGDTAKFTITDAKLHVPIVILSTKDSAKFDKTIKQRIVYWNSYETKPAKVTDQGKNLYELLNASFQGVERLFVLAYAIDAGDNADQETGIKDNKKYFLPRRKIENCNVLIDGRTFYDQSINGIIKQYDEVTKVSTGHGDEYTTDCLLDYVYFKENCRLIAVDLSKQKALDADPRVIEQITFQGVAKGDAGTKIRLYTILEL